MDLRSWLYRSLPHQCFLCRARTTHFLCTDCQNDMPRNLIHCPQCALPLQTPTSVCSDCVAHPKPYSLTLCPWIYDHPIDYVVRQLKSRAPHHLLPYLTDALLSEIHNHYSVEPLLPDVIVPVPSHWSKRLRRGYCHSTALAEVLGKTLSLPVHPWLQQRRKTQKQKTLDRKTRFANLRDAFHCPYTLNGQRIALVDDVITTGATVSLLSKHLLLSGARDVHVWALARTPLFHNANVLIS